MPTTYELYLQSVAKRGVYDANTIALRKKLESEILSAHGDIQLSESTMPYMAGVYTHTIKDEQSTPIVKLPSTGNKEESDRNKLINDYVEANAVGTTYEAKIAADAVIKALDEEDDLDKITPYEDIYNQSKMRFQHIALAENVQREDERIVQYPSVGGRLFKRPMSSLERNWYDALQKHGASSPIARELESEVVKRRLSPFTEESAIPFMRMSVGDTGFFAPPPKSIEERKKGLLDTLLAPLLWGEQASGTTIYTLRKKLGFGGIGWIEEAEKGEVFKEISPSMALGITTRETSLFTARGIAGLAIDIVLDPTSYIGIGVVGKFGKVAKALKITGKAGKTATVGREAIELLAKHTDDIRKAIPNIPIEDARKMAEEEVFDIVEKNPKLLAERKYVEPSIHFLGYPLYVVNPSKRLLSKAWKAAPFLETRTAVVEALRVGFEPFYKVKKAAGVQAADLFAKFYRTVEYERGKWGERAAQLARKRPWFIKRTSEQEFNKQVRQYLERGVEPHDPRALEEALKIREGYNEMFEREVAIGLIEREQYRADYMYRVLTPEARAYLKKELGSEFKEGEEASVYMRRLESAHKRTYSGTIDEINKRMYAEAGIKEFFVADPLKAYFLRGVESARAIESFKLNKAIKTGDWTKTVEELSPVAERTTPKFTPEEIAKKAEKKYGERITKLRDQIGIPENVEVTTIEDVLRYAQRDVTNEDLIKSIDEQIAEVDKQIEAGIWRSEEGVLGAKPDVVTITQGHLTKTAKKAEDALIDLREQREQLASKLNGPYFIEGEPVEDVMQSLASGKGYDITELKYVPKAETKAAKVARERAERYSRHLRPFYTLLEDIKTGEIRPTTVQNVEYAIELESRGMFAGMRPRKQIGGHPYTVREFMENPLELAKKYQQYEKDIFEEEEEITRFQRAIAVEKSRPSPDTKLIESFESSISRSQ
ncbi:MAG TPA: hypothetical protein ENL17_02515, partial [Candidatus Methanoperedenaceae archaeon]|nr:hypothetical protein [Candidatus Methanoperedenaceae archaeon]